MFQGNVERVTKDPTVSAPSTMYFPVAAQPECRDRQIVSHEYRDRGIFPFPQVVTKTRQVLYSQLLLQGMLSVWLHSR